MRKKLISRTALCVVVLAAYASPLRAQTEHKNLTAVILHLDSAFWNAYNSCDTARFQDFLTDDVEFYHDKGGITLGAKALIESLNKNICGNANSHLRREAVAGTVKVYPMQNGDELYGALITGEHKFYITEKGKPEFQSGVANFTQLWQIKNNVWKMTRILSFNHHEPEYINTRNEVDVPAKQLDQLAGSYKSEQSGTMTIIRDNKVLLLRGGNNTFTLYPLSATSFFAKDRDLVFEFTKDTSGKPINMIVKEHGAQVDVLGYEK